MSDPESSIQQPASLPQRAGMVAVIGRANVGKSSLINAILGEKVSIVSPVAQTTRTIVRGILTEPRGQLVLVDTPGMHKAQGDLGRVMNQTARSAVEGTDVAMLVLDASVEPRQEDVGWMKRLSDAIVPVVGVLNKKDLGNIHIDAYKAAWARFGAKEPLWFSISAMVGEGVPELTNQLFTMLPEGPLLFPADIVSDYPRRLTIADVVREKLFHELRDELPHAVAVWVEDVKEEEDGWKVDVVIYVNKSSQKGIVIGEKGRLLRKIRRSSEAELKAMYDRPIEVRPWVKVEPNWNRNFWLLKKFGYVAT